MVDSKFFGIPFAVSGDKATIPEDTQPSGAISYQQGYGPDYERDPATDPLAKRVPRDETNELYYQITNAMRFLQLYGTPEWYALDDNGDPVTYPLTARVRHDAGAGMQAWRSLIASNTTEPGTNPAHWTLDEPYSTAALEASLAQALAGTSALTLITPRRLASSVQQGAWNYVAAGGTANAITATLSPAPASISAGFFVRLKITQQNTGAVTLNVNGIGAAAVVLPGGRALSGGELAPGVVDFTYDGAQWVCTGVVANSIFGRQLYNAAGAVSFTVPDGVYVLNIECWGGGGGGGGVGSAGNGSAGGGGAGGYARRRLAVTPGQVLSGSVGAAGTRGGLGGTGGTGGTTTFGGMSCVGGTGGSPNPTGNGGAGGGATGGDINAAGGAGTAGGAGNVGGGPGGGASFGGAGGGGGYGIAGSGAAPGGGGGGSGAAAANQGGMGALGAIFITW